MFGAYVEYVKWSPISYVSKILQKTNIPYPWYAHVGMCAFRGVRNASFPEQFEYWLKGWFLMEISQKH